MLAVLGGGTVLATAIAAISTVGGSAGLAVRVAAGLVGLAFDVGLFLVAFRVLPSVALRWRDVLPGAVIAGGAWFALQTAGGAVVDRYLRHESETYGTFALVIGLLSWLHLQALVTLFAAEVNVVRWRTRR
jgi:uncharacterized BrkB/YihY/UPF0761 family membrane protein